MPVISIITVNRNDAEGLQKTLKSVCERQDCDASFFEHIVIDGASTDSSVEILQQYDGRLSHWVSEPDNGIFNAMNKGIKQATCEYLLFLNSGDYLADNVLSESIFAAGREDLVYCDMIFVNGDKQRKRRQQDEFSFEDMIIWSIFHSVTFIRRELFENGGYNESFKIVSDWEFFIERFIDGCSMRHVPIFLTYFDANGISNSKSAAELHQKERTAVLERLCIEHCSLFVERFVQQSKTMKRVFNASNARIANSPKILTALRYLVRPILMLYRSK